MSIDITEGIECATGKMAPDGVFCLIETMGAETEVIEDHVIVVPVDEDVLVGYLTLDNASADMDFWSTGDFGDMRSFPNAQEALSHADDLDCREKPFAIAEHSSERGEHKFYLLEQDEIDDVRDGFQRSDLCVYKPPEHIDQEFLTRKKKDPQKAKEWLEKFSLQILNECAKSMSGEVFALFVEKWSLSKNPDMFYEKEQDIESVGGFVGIDHAFAELKNSVNAHAEGLVRKEASLSP